MVCNKLKDVCNELGTVYTYKRSAKIEGVKNEDGVIDKNISVSIKKEHSLLSKDIGCTFNIMICNESNVKIKSSVNTNYKHLCKAIALGLFKRYKMIDKNKGKSNVKMTNIEKIYITADVIEYMNMYLRYEFKITVDIIEKLFSVVGDKFEVIDVSKYSDGHSVINNSSEADDIIKIYTNLIDTACKLLGYSKDVLKWLGNNPNNNTLIDNTYKFLKTVSESAKLQSPYGIAVCSNKNKLDSGCVNMLATVKAGVLCTVAEDETGIDYRAAEALTKYLTSTCSNFKNCAACDELFVEKNDSDEFKLKSGSLKDYYPLLYFSLLYRYTLEWDAVNKKWVFGEYIDDFKEYNSWFYDFFYKMISVVIDNRGNADLLKNTLDILKNYFYVADYNGNARITMKFWHVDQGEQGVSNGKFAEIFNENREGTSTVCQNLFMDSGLSLRRLSNEEFAIPNSDYKYMHVIVITANLSAYYGLTSFAYKEYEKRLAIGEKFNVKNILLGFDNASMPVTISLGGQMEWDLYINAASRSGKGVLGLNVLAGLLAGDCTVAYMDGKPDMSRLLWYVEKSLNKSCGVEEDFVINSDGTYILNTNYERILSVDFKQPVDKHIDRTEVQFFNANSPRIVEAIRWRDEKFKSEYGNISIAGNVNLLAYMKCLQLVFILAGASYFNELKGHRLIVVLDELNNVNAAINDIINNAETKGKKKILKRAKKAFTYETAPSNKMDDEDKKIYDYYGALMKILNDLESTWSQGANAMFTMQGKMSLIAIAQRLAGKTGGVVGGIDKANNVFGDIIDHAKYMIVGNNGNIHKGDGGGRVLSRLNEEHKEAIENISDSAVKIGKNGARSHSDNPPSRSFILTEGLTPTVITTFKPLFTLNRNDLLLANEKVKSEYLSKLSRNEIVDATDYTQRLLDEGLTDNNVGGFLNNNSGRLKELLEGEILEPVSDESKPIDGVVGLNQRIAFLGLLELLTDNNSKKLRDNLSLAYKHSWWIVEKTGLASKFGYSFLEQYLYDIRPETVLSFDEFIKALDTGAVVAETDNNTGEKEVNLSENAGNLNLDDVFSTGETKNETSDNSGYEEQSDYDDTDESDNGTPDNSGYDEQSDYDNTDASDDGIPEDYSDTYDGSGDTGDSRSEEKPSPTQTPTPVPAPTPTPVPNPTQMPIPNPTQTPMPTAFSHTEATTYQDTPDNSYTPEYDADILFKDDGKYHPFSGNAMERTMSNNIIEIIKEYFGDLSLVNTISIENGGHLLVNGIHINPTFNVDASNNVPPYIVNKLGSGQWGEFLHGKDLLRFTNLSVLKIDGMNLVNKYCRELGVSDAFKLKAKIQRKTKLMEFYIDGRLVEEAEREYIEEADRGANFTEGVRNALGGIAGVGSALASACSTIHNSKIWNSGVGRFAKGVAAVGGVAVALPLLSGIITGLGFFGTLNLAIACAGGVYNVVRKRKNK